MKKTLLLSHPFLLNHGMSIHPECPDRLKIILKNIENSNFKNYLDLTRQRYASWQELQCVHTSTYLNTVFAMQGTWGSLDPETPVSPDSIQAACLAVGLGLELVEAILSGETQNGFLLTRPPGHHALADRSMGFCIFNSISIAAHHALNQGIKKVLIIDWDVHHGNGTQSIFYEDSRVFFMDFHQDQLFPVQSGFHHEKGRGAGTNYNLNIPLPHSSSDEDYCTAFDQWVIPAVQAFQPEIILVSAGFDAHYSDPLGSMLMTSHGYQRLTLKIQQLAQQYCHGRTLFFLEGGYRPSDLAENVLGCIQTLVESS